jgi:hypothetical protein
MIDQPDCLSEILDSLFHKPGLDRFSESLDSVVASANRSEFVDVEFQST